MSNSYQAVSAQPAVPPLLFDWPLFTLQVRQQQKEWQDWCTQLSATLKPAGIPQSSFLSALSIIRSRTFAAPYIPWPLSAFVPIAAALQVIAAAAGVAVGVGAAVGVELVGVAGLAAAASSSVKKAQEEEQHALCPLVDMFNHDSRVEVRGNGLTKGLLGQ